LFNSIEKSNTLKVPLLIAQYLLLNRSLSLQGLGTFKLENYYENPVENEKEGLKIPDDSISFLPDKKTIQDDGLISFIAKESGKIKPLASADLDSFVELGKQLLNISKPFSIEGLGLIQKKSTQELEFIQGEIVIQKKEEATVKKKKTNGEDTTGTSGIIMFDEKFVKGRKGGSGKQRVVLAFMILVGVGIIGVVGYYFYNQSRKATENSKEIQKPSASIIPVTDTTSQKPADSLSIAPPTTVTQTPVQDGFNVVLEISSRKRAAKRYAFLKEGGYNVVMTTKDSVEFKLAIPVNKPLSDTAHYRDSLSSFFGRKVWIEKN
jgi:hypothetical protein